MQRKGGPAGVVSMHVPKTALRWKSEAQRLLRQRRKRTRRTSTRRIPDEGSEADRGSTPRRREMRGLCDVFALVRMIRTLTIHRWGTLWQKVGKSDGTPRKTTVSPGG
jgi:hypothetical protein